MKTSAENALSEIPRELYATTTLAASDKMRDFICNLLIINNKNRYKSTENSYIRELVSTYPSFEARLKISWVDFAPGL